MAILPRNVLKKSTVIRAANYTNRWKNQFGSVTNDSTYHNQNGFRNVPFISLILRPPPLAYSAQHYTVSSYSEGRFRVIPAIQPNPNFTQGVGPFGIGSNTITEFAVRASASDVTKVTNGAIAKANAEVKGQHYSAFETLYEGKKTCKMILSAVTTLTRSVRDLRRGNFSAVAKHLGIKTPKNVSKRRSVGNNWLEYRYGWIPLYNTVYGEMKRQYDLLKPKQPIYRVSGSSRQRYYGSTVGGWTAINCGVGSDINGTMRRKASGTGEIRCEVGYSYRVHNETLANTSALGLTNPALLAWEAIPFSFVADWFVNVSDTLGQFDTFAGKEFVSGFKTVVESLQETRTVELVVAPSDICTLNLPPRLSKDATWITRTSLNAPPVINLRFEPGLNVKRVFDAVALLGQVVRRR